MNRITKIALITAGILVAVYLLGPKPERPSYASDLPKLPSDAEVLEAYVAKMESEQLLKPGNAAEIVWADSAKKKTEYVLLYLHGFTASHEEGNPVHRDFANRYGANLYLARLAEHGMKTPDPLLNLTAENLWRSAVEAYAIAKQLGDKVIIMSTSTGGSLALKLAAAYPQDVFALINYSPNIEINDPLAFITNNPWGLQMLRINAGGVYRKDIAENPEFEKYWYYIYRCEAVAALEELLETTMTKETFSRVHCPVLTVAYYKDEEHQDPTVKVSAMRVMMDELGTPADQKQLVTLATPMVHPIASGLKSKDIAGVERVTFDFAEQVLGMHHAPVIN